MIKFLDILREGVKVEFGSNPAREPSPKSIDISYKPIEGEQLNTIDGISKKILLYKVFYSLESDPKSNHIKDSQDALKDHPELINGLKNFLAKSLKSRISKPDYIAYLGSSAPLNKALVQNISEIFNVSEENIIPIEKVEYKYIDDAINWESFRKQSKKLQKDIISYLYTTAEKPGPYVIKGTKKIQGIIVKQHHSKYDLGVNPNLEWIKDKQLPAIYNIIIECLTTNKRLLIIDDNVHTGLDFRLIFKNIEKIIKKYQEEQTMPSTEMARLMNTMGELRQHPRYITSEHLQNEYKRLESIYNEVIMNISILSRKVGENRKNIIGYVLYRLEDEDLKR